jgi:hypothetical protein
MTSPLQSALALGTAFVAAATLSLTGCSQTKEAASGMGDAAKEAADSRGVVTKVECSFCEIYNEQVQDLLAEKKHRAHRKPDNESIKGQFMILIEHFRRILNSFDS